MTHYTPEQLSQFPWIVSCDTLRPEDLLVKFWSAAEQIGATFSPVALDGLQRLVGEDSSESDWSDEQAAELLGELEQTLNDAAPCGFYFGASEGDGACFGFWIGEDWANALETLGFGDDDPSGWAELISRLELDGIEPDTIEDSYQGRAEGYSEKRAGADYAQQLAEDQGLMAAQPGWPFCCIDWEDAWRELEMGDGFRLHDIGGGEWLVFRSV